MLNPPLSQVGYLIEKHDLCIHTSTDLFCGVGNPSPFTIAKDEMGKSMKSIEQRQEENHKHLEVMHKEQMAVLNRIADALEILVEKF
jgi:hypothetical protein